MTLACWATSVLSAELLGVVQVGVVGDPHGAVLEVVHQQLVGRRVALVEPAGGGDREVIAAGRGCGIVGEVLFGVRRCCRRGTPRRPRRPRRRGRSARPHWWCGPLPRTRGPTRRPRHRRHRRLPSRRSRVETDSARVRRRSTAGDPSGEVARPRARSSGRLRGRRPGVRRPRTPRHARPPGPAPAGTAGARPGSPAPRPRSPAPVRSHPAGRHRRHRARCHRGPVDRAQHDRVAGLAPPAPHLDPQAADAALGMRRAQHRQPGREPVAPGRRQPGGDPARPPGTPAPAAGRRAAPAR